MKTFIHDDFLLDSEKAKELYHRYASPKAIIDYHCHLPPEAIAENKKFINLTDIWLRGDHYKWRAMRGNGVDEKYITGDATDFEKFMKWAETVPYTLRNPLYHWTHLELKRFFGIDKILDPSTAKKIYEDCTALLNTEEFAVRNILKRFKVEVICTTDDPADSLEHHKKIKADKFEVKVLPAFRPDKSMQVENIASWNKYIDKLGESAGMEIVNIQSLQDALKKRHEFFHFMGCRLSDHGLEVINAEDYTDSETENIFSKLRSGKNIYPEESSKFKSALLLFFAELDHEAGWAQQFHLGALRNNNSRMFHSLGPDTGFDSIGGFEQSRSLSKFLDRLDSKNKLARTILYNVNPNDNYLLATMIGNFNDGSVPGKMQFGSGWWFLDQKEGIEWQLNALSNLGLLRRFVGMITDSRSFLSYTRHEYFRRVLCNVVGNDIEKGLLPDDMALHGQMIEDICYFNAKNYFGF